MKRPPPDSDSIIGPSGPERVWAIALAAAASGLAILSLVAAHLGPAWAGFARWSADLSPFACWCMLLVGSALGSALRWPRAPAVRALAVAAAALAAVLAAVLGNRSFVAWGVGVQATWHLMPATAVSLVTMAGVLAALALGLTGRRGWNWAGQIVSLAWIFVHGLNLLGQHLGVPVLPLEADQSSLAASWILVGLNLALLAALGTCSQLCRNFLGARATPAGAPPHYERHRRLFKALLLVGIVGGAAAFSYSYLKDQIAEMKAQVGDAFANMADLKVAHLEAWRHERLGDAHTLARAPFLADTLTALQTRPDDPARRAALATYFAEFCRAYGYRAVVAFDPAGRPLLASPVTGVRLDPAQLALVRATATKGEVQAGDLHRTADGGVGLDFAAPIAGPHGAPAGTILLNVDARAQVFPIVENAPVAESSVETFLVRREGKSVLFLSPLHTQPDAPLNFRLPLDSPHLPVVRAVLRRHVDLTASIDARGIPVLWLARPVPGTPWVFVAKIDTAEAFAAFRAEIWHAAWIFVACLLATGLMISNYWRHQQKDSYRRQLEAERERHSATERLSLVLRHANDVILLFDEDMRIVEANERARVVYGYTPEEMLRLTADHLRAASALGSLRPDFAAALTADGYNFESTHRRKDGSVFPVEVSSRAVEIEGRRHLLSVVRDITERKRLAGELALQELRFHSIFDHAPVGIALASDSGLEAVNAEHVRITGVSAADSTKPGAFARASHPEDYRRQMVAAEKLIKGEVDHYSVEKRYIHPDGKVQWAELTSRMFHDPATGERKTVTTLVDIAQRKAHEEEIAQLSRLYLVISQVNQALIRAKNRQDLFAEVCQVLVDLGPFRIAGVGVLNEATREVEPVTVAGDTRGVFHRIKISADPTVPEGRGPSGRAIREGRPFIFNNFTAETLPPAWREEATNSSVQSMISLPLRCLGRIIGVLTVFSTEKDFFGERETRLLDETASDISFALDVFANEAQRREAEAAVQASEQHLKFLITATPAIIYSLRAGDYATTFISPNLGAVLGYEPAAFMADPDHWATRVHPDDLAAAVAAFSKLATAGTVTREYRFRHADGGWRWMHDETRIVRDASGQVQELVGYWLDITARKLAEESLRAREEIFSNIVGQAVDSIALIDAQTGRFLEFNRATHENLGYTREEFATLRVVDIAADNPEEVVGRAFARIRREGSTVFEVRHRRRDGSIRDVRVGSRFLRLQGRDCFAAIWSDITEAKRTETELRKLTLAVEQNPASIVITDLTGAIEYVNPHFTELTGYTLAEVRGKNPRVLKSGHTEAAVFAQLWTTVTAGGVWQGEIVNRKKNGELFTEQVTITPVRDAEGRPTHYLALKEDITARKAAQSALAQSETRFSRLVGMVPLPLGHSDGTGRFTFVNERFERAFGYAAAEVPTLEAWLALAYPDPAYHHQIVEKWAAAVQQAKAGGGDIAAIESTVTCRDGSIRTVEISGALLGEETLMMFADITDRVRGEAKLRQLSRAIDQAPLSIVITDLMGTIEYVNPAFLAVTKYTREEVYGQNPRVLKSGETAPEIYVDMWATLCRREVWRGELRNKKKTGELYDELAVIAPVVNDTGTITHYVALKQDITERKRAERALRESERRFRELFNLESDALLLLEADSGRIIEANLAAVAMYGYPIDVLLTMHNVDLSAEPERTVRSTQAARQMAGVPFNVPLRWHRRRDGSIFPVEINARFFEREGVWLYLTSMRDITARRQAEEALRENRDRLAKAEQIARLGNWSFDLDTKQVTWSDGMFRLLDLDPAATQPSAELYQSFLRPEDRERMQNSLMEILVTRRRFILGHRLFLPDGTVKHVEGTAELLLTAAGAPQRIIGTVQDVTERKLVEIELHDLVKGLRALHQVSQALETRDLGREDLAGLVVRGLVSAMAFPEDARAEISIDEYHQAAGAEGPLLDEFSAPVNINDRLAGRLTVGYVRPHAAAADGPFQVREREVLEHIARAIGLGLGEREALAAVQRFNADLEDKVAQRTAELGARNREIQALLESIPDLVLRLHRDGRVINEQAAKEATPLVGLKLAQSEPLRAAVLASGAQALAANAPVSAETELAIAGVPLTLELRSSPLGLDEFVTFARDITARKRLEAEIAAMLEKERDVSEMKSRFISVTSHEFRTPMAAALGSAELLRNHFDRLAPAKREELFSRIFDSMHRMTSMLDDVLTLNRVDAKRTEVHPAPMDLPVFVQSVIDEVRLGDRLGHRFELEATGELGAFASDPHLLRHILSNLLSNAARYSPEKTLIVVRIEAEAAQVSLAVEDQGIGIPAADRLRIFEPFERGSNVGTIKGTGLGLNIVKRMTDLLGGTISVTDGTGGVGSRFVLTFPRPPSNPAISP